MKQVLNFWAAVSVGLALGAPLAALELRGPRLAAASNFGQGARRDFLAAGQSLPILDFRDAVYWDEVDQGGRFVFTTPTTRYPDQLARWGAGLSLTVNNGHPDHDGGATPLSAKAVAQFGHHAAQMVQRFANIHSVEVGNEFNSANFVSGPLRDAGLEARADAYVALLRSVHDQVKAVRPEVQILGGGVHSIPTGYLDLLLDRGAADLMQAVVLHPYDTPVEMLARQIAVMRRRPELADMPVEITEFGSQDADQAPTYLLKSYCQMALAGVTRAAWYALNPRGDGYVPLFASQSELTEVGRLYAYIQRDLQGQAVRAFAPDPFTFGCVFGDHTAILWGAPRRVDLRRADIVQADRVDSPVVQGALTLSADRPLVLKARDLVPERDLSLQPHGVRADSFYQFGYPAPGQDQAPGDGFARFGRFGDQVIALSTQAGQDRNGVPWVPYRGTDWDRGLRLLSTQLLPSGSGSRPVQIVHQYRADQTGPVDLVVMLDPAARSADGVRLQIDAGGARLADQVVTSAQTLRFDGVALAAGDLVDISVGPNDTAQGDVTGYRFQVFSASD